MPTIQATGSRLKLCSAFSKPDKKRDAVLYRSIPAILRKAAIIAAPNGRYYFCLFLSAGYERLTGRISVNKECVNRCCKFFCEAKGQ